MVSRADNLQRCTFGTAAIGILLALYVNNAEAQRGPSASAPTPAPTSAPTVFSLTGGECLAQYKVQSSRKLRWNNPMRLDISEHLETSSLSHVSMNDRKWKGLTVGISKDISTAGLEITDDVTIDLEDDVTVSFPDDGGSITEKTEFKFPSLEEQSIFNPENWRLVEANGEANSTKKAIPCMGDETLEFPPDKFFLLSRYVDNSGLKDNTRNLNFKSGADAGVKIINSGSSPVAFSDTDRTKFQFGNNDGKEDFGLATAVLQGNSFFATSFCDNDNTKTPSTSKYATCIVPKKFATGYQQRGDEVFDSCMAEILEYSTAECFWRDPSKKNKFDDDDQDSTRKVSDFKNLNETKWLNDQYFERPQGAMLYERQVFPLTEDKPAFMKDSFYGREQNLEALNDRLNTALLATLDPINDNTTRADRLRRFILYGAWTVSIDASNECLSEVASSQTIQGLGCKDVTNLQLMNFQDYLAASAKVETACNRDFSWAIFPYAKSDNQQVAAALEAGPGAERAAQSPEDGVPTTTTTTVAVPTTTALPAAGAGIFSGVTTCADAIKKLPVFEEKCPSPPQSDGVLGDFQHTPATCGPDSPAAEQCSNLIKSLSLQTISAFRTALEKCATDPTNKDLAAVSLSHITQWGVAGLARDCNQESSLAFMPSYNVWGKEYPASAKGCTGDSGVPGGVNFREPLMKSNNVQSCDAFATWLNGASDVPGFTTRCVYTDGKAITPATFSDGNQCVFCDDGSYHFVKSCVDTDVSVEPTPPTNNIIPNKMIDGTDYLQVKMDDLGKISVSVFSSSAERATALGDRLVEKEGVLTGIMSYGLNNNDICTNGEKDTGAKFIKIGEEDPTTGIVPKNLLSYPYEASVDTGGVCQYSAPCFTPAAAASSGGGGGGGGAMIGAVAGVLVIILVVVVVIVLRKKKNSAEKPNRTETSNTGGAISFENPLYNNGAEDKSNPAYGDTETDDNNHYDDMEFDAKAADDASNYDGVDNDSAGLYNDLDDNGDYAEGLEGEGDLYSDMMEEGDGYMDINGDGQDGGYMDINGDQEGGYADVNQEEDGGYMDVNADENNGYADVGAANDDTGYFAVDEADGGDLYDDF